jgi:type 1 fimbria pilin
MKKLFISATVVASLLPALALAESASLTVSGTIIPTACTPSFAGGSIVDLGKISAADLNADVQTELGLKNITLSMNCNGRVPVAVRVHDNQASTQLDGITIDGRAEKMYIYGMGAASGVKIGGYGLRHGTPTVDASAMALMYQQFGNVGGPTWSQPTSTLVAKNGSDGGNVHYSWGRSVAEGPSNGLIHTLPMTLVPVVRAASALPTGSDITLDGSATFELVYL